MAIPASKHPVSLRRLEQERFEWARGGAPPWSLASLAGQVCELSGGAAAATLTFALRLVHEAQIVREPVAWITRPSSLFFPPDATAAGVDLRALIVVRLGESTDSLRAADLLVRSGGFGLVVLDLGLRAQLPIPGQARLAGLARKHGTAVLILTEKERDAGSLGNRVALRAEASREDRLGERFRCVLQALKDRRGAGRWRHQEVCDVPAGLC